MHDDDARPPAARLLVWTGIDPRHEQDFNRWYDREHMQERVALPGFRSARRLRAVDGGARPYLALYDTDGIEVFRTPAYRRAFEQQTAWSRANFARMRDPLRRVGELAIDEGAGEGGALALLVLPAPVLAALDDPRAGLSGLRARLSEAVALDHVVRATLQRTEVALSSPLDPSAEPASADAVVSIEATGVEPAAQAARALASALGLDPREVRAFAPMWRLGRA